MTGLLTTSHYMRRDEDPAALGLVRLTAREARDCLRDVSTALSRWPGRDGRALARAMAAYHWWMATGSSGRAGTWTLDVGTVRAHVRRHPSDLFVLREVFVDQIYAFPYRDVVGDVRRVLDVGSNVGLSPLYFSSVFPQAEVACVEPVPENLEVLEATRAANDLTWHVVAAAVAAEPGEVTLYPSGWWSSSSTSGHVAHAREASAHRPEHRLGRQPVTVRAVTVPQLLDELGWDGVDVLKMDIEGAEAEVLAADADWLDRVGVLAVDIHAKYVARGELLTVLARHGLRPAAEAGAHASVFVRERGPVAS
ncbi:methyltransferase FkbM family [Cellulomonas flavigena DSM 20109]|uniref:Methyltransferase FkbM family n=1 Tax=Cellulomonas flavigena (strain ATCC 482 / DSM 20109 / BCRC 11376 / JCM 18109 / NBRC 3775 / NCIMB 8073 / NRS 134) TaxID=446466 RepID=D5UDM0_CELFN|nr:FkbM family methyltransferase [Cellulomonas flavigena]ADG76476.1 methyltransferase FkbM family [Cellulomonas flavigena DSM 20109]